MVHYTAEEKRKYQQKQREKRQRQNSKTNDKENTDDINSVGELIASIVINIFKLWNA